MPFDPNDTPFPGHLVRLPQFPDSLHRHHRRILSEKTFLAVTSGEVYFPQSRKPSASGRIVWRRANAHSKTVLLIVKIVYRRKFPPWRPCSANRCANSVTEICGNLNRGGEDGVAKQPGTGLVRQ